MTMRYSTVGRIFAMAAVLLLVAACTGGGQPAPSGSTAAATQTAKPGGSFSFAITEPQHLTPGMAQGDFNVTALTFTPLYQIDPKTSEAVAAMAASADSTDQIHWTIKLKSGWTFHNGEPVTAQSFVDAWNATAYGPNAWGGNSYTSIFDGYADLNPKQGTPTTKTLSGVKATDATTITVTLTRAFSLLPYYLAQPALAPMPAAAFSNLTGYDQHTIGNGPYQLDGDWAHNQFIKLKRFEGYKGTSGRADTITAKIYSTLDTAYTDLLAGNLDIVYPLPLARLGDAQRTEDRFAWSTLPIMQYIGFPLYVQKFQDARLRQALSLAIDRKALADTILQGSGAPATSVAPSSVAGVKQDICTYCTYDVARAKQLLADAGGWSGPMTISYYSQAEGQVVEAIANQWRTNLGLQQVTVRQLTTAQFFPLAGSKQLEGPYYAGIGTIYPNIENVLRLMYVPGGAVNYMNYSNPEILRLLGQGDQAQFGSAPQVQAYQQAAMTAITDFPVAPIYYKRFGIAWSARVTDVGPGVQGLGDLSKVGVKN